MRLENHKNVVKSCKDLCSKVPFYTPLHRLLEQIVVILNIMLKGRFQLLNNARNFNDRHLLVGAISVALTIFQLRDHPFKTSANFHKFLTPTPLPSAVF